jgi:hypothetical protein
MHLPCLPYTLLSSFKNANKFKQILLLNGRSLSVNGQIQSTDLVLVDSTARMVAGGRRMWRAASNQTPAYWREIIDSWVTRYLFKQQG